ncbi:MAG: LPS export ABC transporter permease LptF, partial [Nitrospiraceae bacterium]
MIIDRYIIREIAKPLVVVCGILVIIFVGYRSARYLVDAVEGLLPAKTITSLILLKTAIALDVLLPITLYLCVVLTLSRLHADSEIIALSACGVSPSRVLRAVLWLSLLLATLVLSLSLYVRPWAYEKSYRLRAQAEAEFDITRLEAGRFYEGRRGTRVIFVERTGRKPNQVEGVFIQREQGDTLQVIYAKQAYQQVDATSGQRVLVVLDGHQYKLARTRKRDRVLKFEKLEMLVKDEEMTPEYRRKAAPTVQLARSVDPRDTAEFQWRLFTPLSTVLL